MVYALSPREEAVEVSDCEEKVSVISGRALFVYG